MRQSRRAVIAALSAGLSLAFTRGSGARTVAAASPATPEVIASLAPKGRLRAAINVGNVVVAPRDPANGQPRGVSVDIAHEIGRRLGVPVEQVVYPAAAAAVDRQAADDWDIAFLGAEPERAAVIAFTAPYLYVEGTYLVKGGAPFQTVADLDRPGLRIATGRGSAYDLHLARTLKQAEIIRAPSSAAAIELFLTEGLDAAAGVRQALVEYANTTSGLRVLPDSYMRIEQAVAAPQGRAVGFDWLATVIEELKASGFIRASLDRSGQTGAVVAPPA
jgi:polar amino acid transport system substrate-binding protein